MAGGRHALEMGGTRGRLHPELRIEAKSAEVHFSLGAADDLLRAGCLLKRESVL